MQCIEMLGIQYKNDVIYFSKLTSALHCALIENPIFVLGNTLICVNLREWLTEQISVVVFGIHTSTHGRTHHGTHLMSVFILQF